jgi:MFS family permease
VNNYLFNNGTPGVILSTYVSNRSSSVTARQSFLSWLICLSAGLFFFYVFFQLNAFDVINQALRTEFKINAAQLSWMSSSFVWANVIFLLPAGFIIDRFSIRYVILSAMFMCILGTLGFALTHSFVWAFCFHAVSGAANAFCFVSCVVLVSRWFESHRQAFVIGCIVTMAFIGGMVAHAPLAYLNAAYGWRKALLIDSAVGLGLWLWILLVVRDRAVNTTANILPGSYFSKLKNVLTNRNNILCGIYTSCLNLPIMVLCALWGSSYLHVVHHLSDLDASKVVSLIFAGSILGCPLLGWISDKQLTRKPLMLFCAAGTLAVLIFILFGAHLSMLLLSSLFFMLGFFTSAQVISYPYIAESNAANQTGLATSVASIIIMGGGGVGQVLFGWLMHHHAQKITDVYSVADFNFAMWIFPIAIILALVAIFCAYEKKHK